MIRTFTTGRKSYQLLISLAVMMLLSGIAAAQRRERIVSSWKPLHYEVAISLNEQITEISLARTEIRLEVLAPRLRTIDFDFGDMPIDSVSIAGQPATFERAPDRLNIILPRPARKGDQLSIIVTYHGLPKDGLIFANDSDGKPSATGDNWPNRVHQWIPCLDHPSAKATVNFTVAAPLRETVVANGRPLSMTRNGTAPIVWRFEETKSIPAYCMVIAVSEGAKLDATEKTITPLFYYVPQRDAAYAPKGFAPAAPALAFFNQTIGPYPYEQLALIIGATRFGGMENSSAIVFTNNLFQPRTNDKLTTHFGIPSRIENVVAHEIAHQWFGDSVTESTWADLWLSEGFATYFAGLFVEKYEGEAAFRDYMRDAATQYFAYEKKRNAPIHDTETLDLMKLLNSNNYEKGAWVLHMLRRNLGDEAFFRALRNYYAAHRDANATTADLRMALERASGKNLRSFFARWIYGAGHPIYEVSSKPAAGGRGFVVTLTQTQAGPAFFDPVTIRVTSGDTKELTTIQPKSKIASVLFHVKSLPTSIEVDPDERILREVIVR